MSVLAYNSESDRRLSRWAKPHSLGAHRRRSTAMTSEPATEKSVDILTDGSINNNTDANVVRLQTRFVPAANITLAGRKHCTCGPHQRIPTPSERYSDGVRHQFCKCPFEIPERPDEDDRRTDSVLIGSLYNDNRNMPSASDGAVAACARKRRVNPCWFGGGSLRVAGRGLSAFRWAASGDSSVSVRRPDLS